MMATTLGDSVTVRRRRKLFPIRISTGSLPADGGSGSDLDLVLLPAAGVVILWNGCYGCYGLALEIASRREAVKPTAGVG